MGDTWGGHQLLNNAPCEQVLPPFSTSLDTIANMSSTEANPAVGKASRWYPAEDTPQRKKARKSIKPHQTRASLQPGAVLILLAGRFRGRRVILLKHLKEGTLLVTGPFKINGVPIRRVNARYVISTSTKVDISGLDQSTLDKIAKPEYFAREKKSKRRSNPHPSARPTRRPSTSLSFPQSRTRNSLPATCDPASARDTANDHTRWFFKQLNTKPGPCDEWP